MKKSVALLAFNLITLHPAYAATTACTDLSGHYRIESGDTHDITYDTTITQTSCSDIKFVYVDGSGQFTMNMDWKTDGQTRSDGPNSSVTAAWKGGVASWTIHNTDPAPNPLQDSSDSETITYSKVSATEIKRTLDLVNPDGSHDHFEALYKSAPPSKSE
jgi:hypothetical protein